MKLFARLVLVAAFLVAQVGGVAHEIWHSTADIAAEGKAPQKNPLCDFHTALAGVLGAIHGGTGTADVVAALHTAFMAADMAVARFSLLASRSRGPPALL